MEGKYVISTAVLLCLAGQLVQSQMEIIEELALPVLKTILELNHVIEDDKQLENTKKSLDNMIKATATRFDNGFDDMKDNIFLQAAINKESELLDFAKRLERIIEAKMAVNDASNVTKAQIILAEKFAKFEDDVQSEMPSLLNQFHMMMIGQGVVAASRTQGLLCEHVSWVIRHLDTNYDIGRAMNTINDYKTNLMALQVRSFQILNMTCDRDDVLCALNVKSLSQNLQIQEDKVQTCVPLYLHVLADPSPVTDVRINDASAHTSLFIKQTTSIVKDGLLDWNRISKPQPQGLRCSQNDTWTLIKVPERGSERGYYLMDNDDCYLHFDKNFINFEKKFPTVWADSDKIDRREFLICLPNRTSEVAIFMVLPTKGERSTFYTFKEVTTGLYLNVQQKTTSYYLDIDKRLVLVLLLSDTPHHWILTTSEDHTQCKDSGYDTNRKDYGMIIAIVVCGIVVLVVIVFIGVWCYCKKKKKKGEVQDIAIQTIAKDLSPSRAQTF